MDYTSPSGPAQSAKIASRRSGSSGPVARLARYGLALAAVGTVGTAASLVAVAGPAGAAARQPAAASMVSVKLATVAKYGKILENQKGLPLYYDTADKPPKKWACKGGCLAAWPPLVLPKGQPKLEMGKGVTGLSTIKGPSGVQVTWKGKPLYTYITDSAGHATGQGVGHVWYLVQPGKKVVPGGGGGGVAF